MVQATGYWFNTVPHINWANRGTSTTSWMLLLTKIIINQIVGPQTGLMRESKAKN